MAKKFVARPVEATPDNRHKPKLQLDPFSKSKILSFFIYIFTCALHQATPMPPGKLQELCKILATFDGTTLIQAEDDSVLRFSEQLLRESGRKNYSTVVEWRSEDADSEGETL